MDEDDLKSLSLKELLDTHGAVYHDHDLGKVFRIKTEALLQWLESCPLQPSQKKTLSRNNGFHRYSVDLMVMVQNCEFFTKPRQDVHRRDIDGLLIAATTSADDDGTYFPCQNCQNGAKDNFYGGCFAHDHTSHRQLTLGHKDAATIKILTQIATMFLPASLIASLFSSTMFGDSSMNISSVGLYFAVTMPLLLVTLLLIIFLERGLPWRHTTSDLQIGSS
ncbi:hypothetical protein B0T26DRAFT_675228 [Lasiosphaeria miniovina]|uniref:Uncharacterized protein n=1 Tax=Lasiosphaeria miniovina TaxID=1954250 RepID=A0AA40AJ69_9PEZI|nr:uncharacterized protein B0T26DRAFT_675228 [Lasiosphaeria miniovina]KAK0716807.1 hypothetical protein B0T26DRAFT_675228 [Lasiosphaeria miniovina]